MSIPVSKTRKSPLLESVRGLLRAKHRSIRTEDAYVQWIERFLYFAKTRAGAWRHPSELGDDEINAFLTSLATERHVAASTQNQALSARWHWLRQRGSTKGPF